MSDVSSGFYATLDRDTVRPYLPRGIPAMLPMASWWRRDVELRRSPSVPAPVPAIAVDTGSYTLAQHFAEGYPYGFTPENMVRWIGGVQPAVTWAVLPDWPCEGKSRSEVREVQARGSATALHMLDQFAYVPWVWCPVLQGQSVDDYLRHAVDLAPTIGAAWDFYNNRNQGFHFRVCLGSLCRRAEAPLIRLIVEQVAAVLPGVPLHLFGVKLDVLKGWQGRPSEVISVDSAAWNGRFGSDIDRLNADQWSRHMTQRQYTLTVRLPHYAAQVNQALMAPTSGRML